MSWDPFHKDCMLRITNGFKMKKTYMFGIPFIQAIYAIHDLDKHKIGLVRKNKSALESQKYPGQF